jgi:hypothetical protein
MKYYMILAVAILMLITSMGIFGFLSKAHNDQNLVSGDVQSKIAIYDEKIKTERENIEANRKALKQMDATIDETIARSKTDQGAVNANAMRQRQSKERTQIQADIAKSQKSIVALNEERSPIAAEVRKVEAEVGPIKYIAKFIYGDHGADENMLEKAVTWIIIMIVVVFDPLAVIMLLAAQMTFGWRKEESKDGALLVDKDNTIVGIVPPIIQEPNTEIKQTHTEEVPSETPSTALGGDITAPEEPVEEVPTESELEKWNTMIEEAEKAVEAEKIEAELNRGEHLLKVEADAQLPIANDTPAKTISLAELWGQEDESKKKTYMIKNPDGQLQVKTRE